MPRKNDTYILKKIYDSLCSKKSFDIMTVKEIADDVGIPRQKFYDYFSCPEEMFLYYYTIETNKFFNSCAYEKGSKKNISASVCYFRQSSFLKNLLLSKKYRHIVVNEMEKFVYQYFLPTEDNPSRIENVKREYHCKAIIRMFIEYVKNTDKSPKHLELYENNILSFIN